jgi:hypothetical protein
VHGLEAEYWGQVDFIYIDRENPDNRAVVDRFGISYQPVFVLLDENNNEVARWFDTSESTIRENLNMVLTEQ